MRPSGIQKLRSAAQAMEAAFADARPRRRSSSGAAGKRLERDMARVREWWSPNIAGFGIGRKHQESGDRLMKKLVLRFYVYRKLHASRVSAAKLIPAVIPFDHLEADIGTDVRELKGSPQLNFSMAAGDQVGHFSGEAGTAGVFVRRPPDAGTFLLSCAHVLAPPPSASAGNAIESPVDSNSTGSDNQVGELEDFFPLNPGGSNPCDAAIARMDPAVVVSNSIDGLGEPTSLLDGPASLVGTQVSQRGAATGRVVSGTVREMSCTVRFTLHGGTYRISNLVRYEIECQQGDSGAAVLEDGTGRMLGLHTGSEAGSTSAYFSPVNLMVDKFGIEL